MEGPATQPGLDEAFATQQAALTAHEGGIQALTKAQQSIISQQAQIVEQMRRQEDRLYQLRDSLRLLAAAVSATVTQAQPSHMPPTQPTLGPDREPKLQLPLRYDGGGR